MDTDTDPVKATPEQVTELASAIATQAEAIAEGRVNGPLTAAVHRVRDNADTLLMWVRSIEDRA